MEKRVLQHHMDCYVLKSLCPVHAEANPNDRQKLLCGSISFESLVTHSSPGP